MGLWKRHCVKEKDLCGPRLPSSLSEKLPNDACGIGPTLLRKRATKEYVVHGLHLVRAAMKAALINCGWDPPLPFIHRQRLMKNRQRKAASFYAMCLCQIKFQLEEIEGGISFFHLSRIDFFKSDLCATITHTKFLNVWFYLNICILVWANDITLLSN